ncbi:laccase 5 [Mycena rebaudengoi]|nr:laccase 5 [Mycena rebaudengoi]
MAFATGLLLSLVSIAVAVMVGPTAENADIVITNAQVAPDGDYAVLAGGLIPGPTIRGNKGDVFNLNVIDQLTDNTMLRSTTIHWHGFFQQNNSWADGPAFVTQCPIAANNSFLYSFPTAAQAGTFWYHSHLFSYIHSPVYDQEDPHRHLYDSTVITISDWYHGPARTLGVIPTLISTLINGLGRYAGGPTSQLAVVTVTKGLRYRFRLVSLACDPNWIFTIDGHSFTIIEVDSVNHAPLLVDSIQIFAGQRYSFILNANQPEANYWIRTVANQGTSGFDNGINSAILRYVGAPEEDPVTTVSTSLLPLNEANLHPLDTIGAPGLPFPGAADININLAISLDFARLKFLINGVDYVSPTVPVLLQILSGAHSATDLLPAGSVYILPPNKVIELSIPPAIGGPHPIHLHGHNFHVIRSVGSSGYNFINPSQTLSCATKTCVCSFVTDNAGPGLAIVFAEDTDTVTDSVQPPEWDSLCPIYDALTPDQL